MKKFSFFKYSGAGNDFILVDKNENPDFSLNEDEITQLCARRTGIGANGVLLISDADQCDFSVEYFNSDGSTGMLCANGARCSIDYAMRSKRLSSQNASFEVNNKAYKGVYISDGLTKLFINDVNEIKLNIRLNVEQGSVNLHYLNTGAPQAVISFEDLKSLRESESTFNNLNVDKFGKIIRHHEYFAPVGTNVNFIELLSDKVNVRTFEKGVEAETLASGTGSTASAIIASLMFGIEPPVRIKTYGNFEMEVDFINEEKSFKNISLTGPVKLVYKGDFII